MSRRSDRFCALCLFVTAVTAVGQSPTITAPPIDVLSVKRNLGSQRDGQVGLRPDGIYAQNTSVLFLLQIAFQREFPSSRIENLPAWANTEHYDVVGKIADADLPRLHNLNRSMRNGVHSQMILAALTDRFHLKFHIEEREGPVYALVIAKGGPKITISTGDGTSDYISPSGDHVQRGSSTSTSGYIAGSGVPLSTLTRALMTSGDLDRVVIDRTGLIGNYNFALHWTTDSAFAASDSGVSENNLPNLFTALPEQLGLRLEPSRGPIKTLVIDHIEKPAAN